MALSVLIAAVMDRLDVNPISHLVTASRGLMAGTVTAGQVGWVLAASAALTAIFAPLTVHLYRNKGQPAARPKGARR